MNEDERNSKRIDNLEIVAAQLDKRLSIIEIMFIDVKEVLKNVASSLGDVATAVQDNKIATISFSNKLDSYAEKTQKNEQDLCDLEIKFYECEEKGKIDWRTIFGDTLKSKMTVIIASLFGGGFLISACQLIAVFILSPEKIDAFLKIIGK